VRLHKRRALITGGAGFIGANLADWMAAHGFSVTIYDNLSRAGVEDNLEWLRRRHGETIEAEIADVRNAKRLTHAVQGADWVFHLAAQVAVTSSLGEPRHDFEVNAGGTLNVLEAIRSTGANASLVFTSTNKVYGDLSAIRLRKSGTRYEAANAETRLVIGEETHLSFHSPYGCSKGAADQYVLDYARSFGVRAVVFRMSCIYGPHQMGTEDQGWIAHFIRQTLQGKPITICGDGLQVRDVLFVEDLVNAMQLAQKHIDNISGQAFNIGGGADNTISLVELLKLIEQIGGSRPAVIPDDWRQGDQRYYVSDISKFTSAVGWFPKVTAEEGIRRLYQWLATDQKLASAMRVGGQRAVLAS